MIETPNPYEAPATVESHLVDPDSLAEGRLRTTAVGLKTIHAGILLVLIAWALMVPTTLLFGGWWIVLALSAALVAGVFLVNIGPLFCLTVPSGLGLRPWVIATVITQVFTMGLSIAIPFLIGVPMMISVIAAATGLLPMGLFLVFLYLLSQHIERVDLVRRARNVFIHAGITILVAIATTVAVDLSTFSNTMIISSVLFLFMVIFTLVSYANLVNAIGDAIRNPRTPKPLVGVG